MSVGDLMVYCYGPPRDILLGRLVRLRGLLRDRRVHGGSTSGVERDGPLTMNDLRRREFDLRMSVCWVIEVTPPRPYLLLRPSLVR